MFSKLDAAGRRFRLSFYGFWVWYLFFWGLLGLGLVFVFFGGFLGFWVWNLFFWGFLDLGLVFVFFGELLGLGFQGFWVWYLFFLGDFWVFGFGFGFGICFFWGVFGFGICFFFEVFLGLGLVFGFLGFWDLGRDPGPNPKPKFFLGKMSDKR